MDPDKRIAAMKDVRVPHKSSQREAFRSLAHPADGKFRLTLNAPPLPTFPNPAAPQLMAMRIKRREMVSKRNAEKKKARLVLREQKATAELKARRIERELLKKKFKDVQAALKALHGA